MNHRLDMTLTLESLFGDNGTLSTSVYTVSCSINKNDKPYMEKIHYQGCKLLKYCTFLACDPLQTTVLVMFQSYVVISFTKETFTLKKNYSTFNKEKEKTAAEQFFLLRPH